VKVTATRKIQLSMNVENSRSYRYAMPGAVALALAFVAYGTPSSASAAKEFHEWHGSRTIPVHRIALYDEDGGKIVPQDRASLPFSARKTCGGCHDYEKISHGWHFDYAEAGVDRGRPAQPWIWMDERTGTQIPVSQRGWTNTWKIEALGISPWEFMKQFGRHLPGGGLGETSDDMDDPTARWSVSGHIEINCLVCHSGSEMYNNSEWAKQVGRENFRWAATAASGLGDVGGMASRVAPTWDVYQGPNKDDSTFAVAPFVRYDLGQFNRKSLAFIDIAAMPQDKRCLYCHSVAEVGKSRKDVDWDVHSRGGMNCVECHRNGMDHMVTRGIEAAAGQGSGKLAEVSSCRGCHLGGDAKDGLASPGGRLGAPYPKHKGFPAIHFEKLTCTACHSGPLPAQQPVQVRTARANRMGIYGVAQWFTDLPSIVEPVFMKGEDGRIGPYRMTWPAFWARLEKDQVKPIRPEEISKAASGILDTSAQLNKVLKVLSVDAGNFGMSVFADGSRIFRVNVDGGLDVGACKGTNRPPAGTSWLVERDDASLAPLAPSCDPAAETLDPEIEGRYMALLKALAGAGYADSGVPVVAVRDRLFKLGDDGVLNRLLLKDEVADSARMKSDVATWGWLKNRKIAPLVPDFVVRSVIETVGTGYRLTEEQVTMGLKTLAEADAKSKYAYISSGKMFTVDQAGALVASDHSAAQPVAWPLAHEVRPARQALGSARCIDCHSVKSPFFFGAVAATGPLKTTRGQVKTMAELQGQDATFHRLFGMSFLVRSWYKTVLVAMTVLIGAILALYGLLALRRVIMFFGSTGKEGR